MRVFRYHQRAVSPAAVAETAATTPILSQLAGWTTSDPDEDEVLDSKALVLCKTIMARVGFAS